MAVDLDGNEEPGVTPEGIEGLLSLAFPGVPCDRGPLIGGALRLVKIGSYDVTVYIKDRHGIVTARVSLGYRDPSRKGARRILQAVESQTYGPLKEAIQGARRHVLSIANTILAACSARSK